MAYIDQGLLFPDIEPLFLRERRNAEARELIFGQLLPSLCAKAIPVMLDDDIHRVYDIEDRLLRCGRDAYISPEELAVLKEIAFELMTRDDSWDEVAMWSRLC
jgi:hypothetical protein